MKIYRVSLTQPLPRYAVFPCLTLRADAWDDYGFNTLFHIRGFVRRKREFLNSTIKILQRTGPDRRGTVRRTHIAKDSDGLSELYCSLGQDTEYYEQLLSAGSIGQEALAALRDVAVFRPIFVKFQHLAGFNDSLTRFSGAQKALKEGRDIIQSQHTTKTLRFNFACAIGKATEMHKVDFNFADENAGLQRSMVLIGRNGTGKTEYLAALARATSGLRKDGEFTPERPSFSRVVAVSFSVFDVFQRPNVSEKRFSYRYVGLRRDPIASMSARSIRDPLRDRLMTQAELFRRLQEHVVEIKAKKSFNRWKTIVQSLVEDEVGELSDRAMSSLEFYRHLSSGQKFSVSAVTGIIANVVEDSLILFDEPEHHLHPDIFSLFLRAMAKILVRFKSYAVYATHSPLLLQQTPARQVRIFNRIGNVPSIVPLTMESFGENLTVITQEVFASPHATDNFAPILQAIYKERQEFDPPGLFRDSLPLQTATQIQLMQERLRA